MADEVQYVASRVMLVCFGALVSNIVLYFVAHLAVPLWWSYPVIGLDFAAWVAMLVARRAGGHYF